MELMGCCCISVSTKQTFEWLHGEWCTFGLTEVTLVLYFQSSIDFFQIEYPNPPAFVEVWFRVVWVRYCNELKARTLVLASDPTEMREAPCIILHFADHVHNLGLRDFSRQSMVRRSILEEFLPMFLCLGLELSHSLPGGTE